MKKTILILASCLALFASDGKTLTTKCVACHGTNFEKKALGKSEIAKDKKTEEIKEALIGYKEGTLNKNGMGTLMKTQMATLSDEDIKIISKYISSLK